MRPFKFLLLLLLTSFFLEATIYEDAEDKKTSRWKLLNSDAAPSVNNIHDLMKKSRVIEFQGKGTKDIYKLKAKKTKRNEYWLSWQMKFSEDFVIIIVLNTNIGEHYLIYTPGIRKSYMQYGLGYFPKTEKWQTFNRNLQEDIAYFDNRIKVTSLKSFVLKGNGKIDNIMTKKNKLIQKIKLIKKNKLVKKDKFSKIYKQKKHKPQRNWDKTTNSLPSITVHGAKFMQLNLGQTYVEKGVSAYDKEDGQINVVSMENIDNNQVGRYMILYMATDSDGNMALDKRYVDVGNLQSEEGGVPSNVLESEEEREEVEEEEREEAEEDSDEISDLSEEEVQIRVWERELILREKELAEREKKSNKK